MRRLTALAVAAAALTACGSGSHQAQEQGLPFRVDTKPFRVTVLGRDGTPVLTQDRDARLRYQLASNGEQHKLTDVISSSPVKYASQTFDVATDEPGRTAVVTLQRTSAGVRLSLRLRPETNVQQVYDAFETGDDDHFLGSGERPDSVDLRGQIVQVKVAEPCAYAAVPFFASSAGWAVRLDTDRVSAFAFPGSPGGTGCKLGTEPGCGFPPLEHRAEVCVTGAKLDEDLFTGSLEQTLKAYEAKAGRPRVPPPSEL
jgi:alpha-D-xyloside xylohydrolase